MTNQAKDEGAPDPKRPEDAAPDPGEALEAGQPAADATEETEEEDAFARLGRENEELRERSLRLAAEMENLRKRTARDVSEARTYGIANFARDMLTVSDNLRRALEAVPEEIRESDPSLKTLVEGVEMTERGMLASLERHGVKKIDPEGEKFDPNFHQAMFEVPDSGKPANTVVQVVQTGYVIGERVLRPAMVGVAKGGGTPPRDGGVGQADTDAEPGPPDPYSEKDA